MKDFDTITVSRVGQSTLPKWWRNASGLSRGGVVEVRPVKDGKNSIVLTPRPAGRSGATGLLAAMQECPFPMPPVARHSLPPR
jgi:bifunctional DNA-binding transcriptional regulator/antitoxin component of YhaV-PrlF toxin-antitoxin module